MQQQQQLQQQQQYNINQANVGVGLNNPNKPQIYQQQQQTAQTQQQPMVQQQQPAQQMIQQQQQQQNPNNFVPNYQQPQQQQQRQVQIWEGQIEWVEKDRNNPNIKLTHMAQAAMLAFTVLDTTSGQYVPEVSPAATQTWPPKIPLQMMSKQILDILSPSCGLSIRNLLLYTENQDVKNALTNVGVCKKK